MGATIRKINETLRPVQDFNRVLAQQPRTSIQMPSFQPPPHNQPLEYRESLEIPLLQITDENEIRPQPTVTADWDTRSIDVPFSTKSHTPLRHHDQESHYQQYTGLHMTTPSIHRSPSISPRPMNNDPVVLARSLLDLTDQQQAATCCPTACCPQRTVVERNGKQFAVEVQYRTERRYIQYYDPAMQRKRIFEVTDCIPYRTVQPCRPGSTYSLRKNDHWLETELSLRSVHGNESRHCSRNHLAGCTADDCVRRGSHSFRSVRFETSTSDDSAYSSQADSRGADDRDYESVGYSDTDEELQSYYNQYNHAPNHSSSRTYRKDTGATHEIIGRYQLPTPADSFILPHTPFFDAGSDNRSLRNSDNRLEHSNRSYNVATAAQWRQGHNATDGNVTFRA